MDAAEMKQVITALDVLRDKGTGALTEKHPDIAINVISLALSQMAVASGVPRDELLEAVSGHYDGMFGAMVRKEGN